MSIKNGKYNTCSICGKVYYIRADRADKSKYCSRDCWNKRRKLKKCEYCGEEIVSYYGKKYCSRECAHKAMVGEKSPRWKDGKSLLRDRARDSNKVRRWRKAVFERDNYTCQNCGEKGFLQAHHIIEWAKDESKRFDISNGITLCIKCHGKIHGKDFTHRAKNKCKICGKVIKRESQYCRSCSSKKQWEYRRMHKLDPNLPIKINGKIKDYTNA